MNYCTPLCVWWLFVLWKCYIMFMCMYVLRFTDHRSTAWVISHPKVATVSSFNKGYDEIYVNEMFRVAETKVKVYHCRYECTCNWSSTWSENVLKCKKYSALFVHILHEMKWVCKLLLVSTLTQSYVYYVNCEMKYWWEIKTLFYMQPSWFPWHCKKKALPDLIV